MDEWRDATPDEVRVIRHLLSVEFPGCETYRVQTVGLKVEDRGDDVFYLHPPEDMPNAEPPKSGSLVDGTYLDSDGAWVVMFIATKEGRLHFLDVMKSDSDRPLNLRWPPDESIAVAVSSPPHRRR